MEKLKVIKETLKTTHRRKNSNTNVRIRPLDFEVDDFVYLKVSPMKAVMKFSKKGKLSSQYIIPYRICKKNVNVAYVLELPQE